MNESLNKFGAFFVQNLRDSMFDWLNTLLRGEWKAPDTQELQDRVKGLKDAERQVLRDLIEHITTTGMHDLLFALQEQADADGAIRVLVDGNEVAKLSDGLHGELFGDDGWIVRYSRYPSQPQIDLSRWAEEQIREILDDKSE
jgi:hypothetical protein